MSFEILPTPALETSTEHTVAAPCLVACFVTGNTRNACNACCACCNAVLLEAPPSKSRVQEIFTISTKIEVCLIVKHTDIPYSHIETPMAWLPISLLLSDWPLFHGLRVVFSPALWAGGSHPIKRWDPGTHCLPWPWSSLDPLHPPREAWEPERPPEYATKMQQISGTRMLEENLWNF